MNPLGASLLHSLWQGGVIWGALFLLLRMIPARAVVWRYRTALAAVALVTVVWLATWSWLADRPAARAEAQPVATMQKGDSSHGISSSEALAEDREMRKEPVFQSTSSLRWRDGLLIGWAFGVVLGFCRIGFSLASARRLLNGSVPLQDPRWLQELEQVCAALQTRAVIGLRASHELLSPVVVGIFRPVIIFPASLLAGISPEMLRAALAHEIAHVARWDFLVNLLQMGVEALLFFNPFVWLINQTVRREREACCDAAASRVCGDSATYSEALVQWTRLASTAPAGAALAMSGRKDWLGDRVRRLLYPAHVPQAGRSWRAAAGWMGLVVLFFLGAGWGVRTTVARLTDRERVDRIYELTATVNIPAESKKERRFSGIVLDEQGKPVAEAAVYASSEIRNSSTNSITADTVRFSEDGRFEGTISEGTLQIRVISKGYAPLLKICDVGQPTENLTLTLSRGIGFAVRCVEADGRPIPKARVFLRYQTPEGTEHTAIADEDGVARFPHESAGESVVLQLVAPGFQEIVVDRVLLREGGPLPQYALTKAEPYILTVIDEKDGTPLKGVSVRVQDMSPHPFSGRVFPSWNGILTDESGVTRLEGLNPNYEYEMLAELDGRGTRFRIAPRREKASALRLPRERQVHLKIINLEGVMDPKIRVDFAQLTSGHQSASHSAWAPVTGRTAEVTLRGLRPDPVRVYVFRQKTELPVLEAEQSEFVIDWAKIKPLPKNKVVVQCDAGKGGAAPLGGFNVSWVPPGEGNVWTELWAPIENGRAEFELPAGALFRLKNNSLMGGTVDELQKYEVTSDPFVINVPVKPAGLIRVKVLEPDGKLASRIFISAYSQDQPGPTIEIKNGYSEAEAPREWHPSRPVPFGRGRFRVRVTSDNRVVFSSAFRVDAEHPIQDVVVTLPKIAPREVKVVDQSGTPVPKVDLLATITLENMSFSGGRTIQTDRDGIAMVPIGANGKEFKTALIPISSGYIPEELSVDFSRPETPRIVLTEGRKVTGRVVDKTTGAGVVGAQVGWAGDRMRADSVATDSSGAFTFFNLPPQQVVLSIYPPQGKELEDKRKVHYIEPDVREVTIYAVESSKSK